MSSSYIKDLPRLLLMMNRFTAFVYQQDGRKGVISFCDKTGFLGSTENFKTIVSVKAREELKCEKWTEAWIGKGIISDRIIRAVNKSDILVHRLQKTRFSNRVKELKKKDIKALERVIYNIYANPIYDEAEAFSDAVKIFGGNYETIAFLFFIKDDTRFLPISPGNFDKAFKILGIDYSTTRKCSWENYQGYIQIINEIRDVMDEELNMSANPRLIDAHSFLWVLKGNDFNRWEPSKDDLAEIELLTENQVTKKITGSGGSKDKTSKQYYRSEAVVKETRRRANGICQLCKQTAPFNDKKGNPYLEVHHIDWLSKGGEDSTDNTVALCPNCHTRMHVLDNKDDVKKLKEIMR